MSAGLRSGDPGAFYRPVLELLLCYSRARPFYLPLAGGDCQIPCRRTLFRVSAFLLQADPLQVTPGAGFVKIMPRVSRAALCPRIRGRNCRIVSDTPSLPTLPLYTEERPWGSFTVLQDEPHFKLKKLRVSPGHRLSLQLHHRREEHWIVTQGSPRVTVGERTWEAQTGEYIHVPRESRHRLENAGPGWVEMIEVQQGDYFGEDDIVRFSDDYNRV